MANQNNNKGGQQQDVNQLLKVRREKLQNLQEAGKDPFQITKYNVTHHSSDVKELRLRFSVTERLRMLRAWMTLQSER